MTLKDIFINRVFNNLIHYKKF